MLLVLADPYFLFDFNFLNRRREKENLLLEPLLLGNIRLDRNVLQISKNSTMHIYFSSFPLAQGAFTPFKLFVPERRSKEGIMNDTV